MLMHDYMLIERREKYTHPPYLGKPFLISIGILTLILFIARVFS